MAEHLKMSEGELNELLAEYWKLRHETGITSQSYGVGTHPTPRRIYGNSREQIKHASHHRLTSAVLVDNTMQSHRCWVYTYVGATEQ